MKIQQFMTEADAKEIYIQFLDENFPVIQILGMTYRVAYALERTDPTAFRCFFIEWMNAENICTEFWDFQPRKLDFPDGLTRKIAPLSYQRALEHARDRFHTWQIEIRSPYVRLDDAIYYYIDDREYLALSDDELLEAVMIATDFPEENNR